MTKAQLFRLLAVGAAVLVGVVAAGSAPAAQGNTYTVHPLVSNGGVPAPTTDPHLVNAWGLTAGPTTPWWVSDNGVDLSTIYKADGSKQGLEVHVNNAPTGAVFANIPGNFPVGAANQSALFIWSTESGTTGSGTIQGWHPSIGTTAQVKVTSPGAVYKGLAIATTATGPRLYATDFAQGRVDVFNGAWAPVTTAGGFVDPSLPDRYAPFGIQTIGKRIFVTYAKQSGGTDELHGQSLGIVDAYDVDGRLLARVAQHGQLNAPWGLALAPATFGRFGGDCARRQLRRRSDQRVWGAPEWAVRAPRRASHRRREVRRDRRALGAPVRARRSEQRSGEHAVLHRRAERRVGRTLRLDHGELTSPARDLPAGETRRRAFAMD